jgi:hypothetical protein
MAGKQPQDNPQSGAQGKRPAINIATNFDEPSRAKVAKAMAAADRRGELPTTRSNIIVWSVVAIVMGLPVIAIIWLIVMPDNPVDRYPVKQVIEARMEMATIGQRAKKIYETNPQSIPTGPTLQTFGVTEQELGGEFDISYNMSYSNGILTIFAPAMFADAPTELIGLMNLNTGEMTYNREATP